MKAVKIILAVLLLLAILPASGCVFSQSVSQATLEDELEELSLGRLSAMERNVQLPDAQARLDSVGRSLALLCVCTFLFVLSAGIIAIAWRKKFYGAFVSGVLVLILYIWNSSLQNKIERFAGNPLLRKCKSFVTCTDTSTLKLANILLLFPMVLLLIIGIIDIIFYFVKKRKTISLATTSNIVEDVVTTSQKSNIDDFKKYKELLDAGIITQEEFDQKKKQLLGL